MRRLGFGICLISAVSSVPARVSAEGSAEFDAADTAEFRAHDQAVDDSTVAYVDILDGAREKVCYRGNDTALGVYLPAPNDDTGVGTLLDRECVDAVDGVDGAYRLTIGAQTIGTEWDIRVCSKATADADCLDSSSNERLGRLWSYDWSFQQNKDFGREFSVNGSIYAIVPGGSNDHDAVVEMQMRGVSGAFYHLFANSYGPETGSGQRIGRSAVAREMNIVRPGYPIYLNPPEVARYNLTQPQVSNVTVESSCGNAVVREAAPGTIRFESNSEAQYVVICDVNRDDVYDLADPADFSAFGTAGFGANTVRWNGDTTGGEPAAPGSYSCVIRLNIGEFHFMAEDIETADPGIRMFRVDGDKQTRVPLRMFWDDSRVTLDTRPLRSSGFPSPNGSPPDGLDPGAYADDPRAYFVDGNMRGGNARAWGTYDEAGKGNDAFLDQFASPLSVQSQPVRIRVVAQDADPDADGLSTQRECELGTDPSSSDSDGDNVSDGFEATPTQAQDTDADGVIDALDPDDDGDGLATADELGSEENGDGDPADALDTDRDDIPDYLDTDSDADNVPDRADLDPRDPRRCRDADRDGCDDCALGMGPDPSADGSDTDGDGRCDAADRDAGGPDSDTTEPGDADGDGVSDEEEMPGGQARDTDSDGIPDYLDDDDDDDGIPTRRERPDGQDIDTDGDGRPDHLDSDDDGDGIPTRREQSDSRDSDGDTDGDAQPNRLDVDDDGDGIPTRLERSDLNQDGTPDYLQVARPGTLRGGARCSLLGVGQKRASGARAKLGGSPVGLIGLIGLIGLTCRRRRRRRRSRQRLAAMLLSLGVATVARPASAQVALDQFKPAPLASDGFALGRPDVSGHLELQTSVWLDYANDPLIYEPDRNDSSAQQAVVRDHLVLHAGMSLGLYDRLSVFALIPVHLIMSEQDRLTVREFAPEGAGLGDLAMGARIRLVGQETSSAALSGELVARLPTAELANADQLYSGDAVGSYEPALIGEVRTDPFDLWLRAGVRVRKAERVGNLRLGQELVFGFGLRWRASRHVAMHAEAFGSTFFSRFFGRAYTPLELLLGVKVQEGDVTLGLAAGPGVLQGYGSPDLRVVGMLGYAPGRSSAEDSDLDGIYNAADRCPSVPEDHDGFQDEDGCPDLDNDQDGIADALDGCPLVPEDLNGVQDDDGCPESDADGDGVMLPQDQCPGQPEDRDGFQDEDGCPDPDNDYDGRPDALDKCPNEAEDYDGFEDSDGCPEEGSGLVRLTCDRIEITDTVHFETNSDVIQPRSFALLDQVTQLLIDAPQITRLRVEGHADSRGAPEYNLDLSRRRAASVMRYLIDHGIAPARLESQGYGVTRPIANNDTAQGQAENRRVEFKVIEQQFECVATPASEGAPPAPVQRQPQ